MIYIKAAKGSLNVALAVERVLSMIRAAIFMNKRLFGYDEDRF